MLFQGLGAVFDFSLGKIFFNPAVLIENLVEIFRFIQFV